ncbi:hypothetical protein NLJ89_g11989 [Agrocybe chaxingu]|uniref:Uncharacterized protein n=1 Tax=Agrocybe chaxingu TaxID=84603 RepID=A0A9W8JRD8_9AGAR|nr:hypothetical protein NLJ89_g11989 [Agrocybe chaxingu]
MVVSAAHLPSQSELIWERIKGALGIPPELDVDYDFLNDDESSPDTSDISDDEGKGARGHWSDWDATMDSPVYARKRLSMESPVPSLYSAKRDDHEAHFSSQIEEKLQDIKSGLGSSSTGNKVTVTASGETTTVPTPYGRGARSPPDQNHGVVIGTFSPPNTSHQEVYPADPTPTEYISIEPILAPSTSNSFSSLSGNPPPLSLPGSLGAGDGLGDIAEGAEEEEYEESTTDAPASTTETAGEGASSAPEDDPNYISPSQIQGLRISTSPMPLPASFGTPPLLSPISPLPPLSPMSPSGGGESPSHTQTYTQPQAIPSSGSYSSSRPHSRASSFSSIGPFQRSESTGNLSASWSAAAAIAAAAAMQEGKSSYYAGSDAGDSSGYISDGDRLPGNPLFPSNFARLGRGPSLRAK